MDINPSLTNNIMELMAVIEALKTVHDPSEIEISHGIQNM